MCGSSPDYGADYQRMLQQNMETAQRNAMKRLDKTFAGYDDTFYDKAATRFIRANEPDFQKQARATQEALGFRLANQGLFNSSAGQKLGTALSREITSGQQNLADQGMSYADQLRRQVENYRLSVAQQIQSAANPQAALTAGVHGMQAFTMPSASTAIGNMFGNFAQQYLLSNLMAGTPGGSSGSFFTTPGGVGTSGLPATQTIVKK